MLELENDYEFAEVGNPPVPARAPARTARQIYASQTKVRPAVDANFSSIFSDRNKVVVIAFWADSCTLCAEAATAMTAMADRYSKGPAGPVKFYHVQWDPRVNPRVHQQFGFRSVPVVFFYYTSTGRPPSRVAPLLEGSLGHDEKHDPNRYVRTIEAILQRHAPAKVRSVRERRGWKKSTDLISDSDFADIDQLLVEPSPFQSYLQGQYRVNPDVRLSKLGIIQIKPTYDSTYQTVNGRLPGPDNAGTFDKKNLKLYLLSVNIQLQTFLGRAIHEAIHMFCCPVKGTFTQFHNNNGFGITEGFTQYITEEILKSQKLTIISPSPYQHELAAVKSLIRVVGVPALAEDYFLCQKRVYERLNKINKYSAYWRLSHDADDQRDKGSERGMIEAYQKLIRFLDAINPQPASSTSREYLELPWNEFGAGSNYENRRNALNHPGARRLAPYFEDRQINNFNRGMARFRLEGETADAINKVLKLNPKGGYVKGSTARRKLDEAIATVPGSSAASIQSQLAKGQDPIGKLFRYRLHPETQRVLLAILANKAQEFQQHSQTAPQPPQPSATCQLFLPAKAGSYEDYVAAQTTGRITLLINGRNSGGAGPDDNVDEAFDRMQEAVEALQPGDTVYLAAWHFDPTVPLTNPGPPGVKTWGELFKKKANDGVKIRIIMTDFAPIAQVLHAKLYNDFLPALDNLVSQLPTTRRDNLKYIVSRHPATQFTVHVATHHQKFMVLKKSGATNAFCGGLDIAYMRTPFYWTAANYPWLWHDLHSKLEGRIARDLELEFVLRWNREKNASVVGALSGWKPMETLVQAAVNPIDLKPDSNQQKLQMLRTVSVQGPGLQIQTIRRDDIWQGYLRLIGCATRFIYMENQYFREPRMADAIVKQAKAQPELIVIIVVPEQLDDPNDAIKRHGNWLQYNFFLRLFAGVPANRRRVYTMFHRIIHSKLVMVDDHALTIGSANANPRGFFLDTELNVILDDADTVTSFRHRLWSHNLGVPQNNVAGWAVPEFMLRWDTVASANLGLKGTPDEVMGEGVIPFDPLLEKGQQQPHIADVLTEVKDSGMREGLEYRRFIPSRW